MERVSFTFESPQNAAHALPNSDTCNLMAEARNLEKTFKKSLI